MRVRQWAVVGAALVAAWSGGAGIAQATGDSTPVDPGCLPALAIAQSSDDLQIPDSCYPDIPTQESEAAVGCDGVGLLVVAVDGVEPGLDYTLRYGRTLEVSEPFTADDDGTVVLITEFTPDGSSNLFFDVEGPDGNPVASGDPEIVDTCDGDAALTVGRDCLDPETLKLDLVASGLQENEDYTVVYTSDGFQSANGEQAFLAEGFETDADGSATLATTATEEEGVTFPLGEFTIDAEIYLGDDWTTSAVADAKVVACTTGGGTQPGGTTPNPDTAAPVVVTHPAAAQPAVLANTGTPVTSAALLGGGLLLAGAGAMVATRRRAS